MLLPLLPGRRVGIILAVAVVLTSCIVASAEDETSIININLGFDLVQKKTGDTILSVGSMEERRPRAAVADDSDDNDDQSDAKPKEAKESSGSDDNESDNDDDGTTFGDRITRGLLMDEKELHPKSRHSKKDDDDDNDDDDE